MFPSEVDFLKHILDECDYLSNQRQLIKFDDLTSDKTLSHAFCRSLEIIGEASKKINENFKKKYPFVDWKRMSAMRDKIIHNYFGVDLQIVWDTIQHDIPELQQKVQEIIKKESNILEK